MKDRYIVIGAVSIAALVLAVFLFVIPNLQKPNEGRMREYRLSKLSDQDLRNFHAQAEKEVAEIHAHWDRQMLELGAQRQAEIVECESKISDVAYKTRHYPNGCPNPILPEFIQRPRMQSVKEAYENLIMGGCEYRQTVLEARFAGCLP